MMRVKWIDGAKGIAILMVIAIHLSQCLPNLWRPVMVAASFGAMGVQLFFIMSAYCACMTWRPERFSCLYWWKKYKRLAIWYFVGIAVYWVYWLYRDEAKMLSAYSFRNIIANMMFVNGFIPEARNSIVPGGWSISCIALFLFGFPFLMKLSRRVLIIVLTIIGISGCIISIVGYKFWGWSRVFSYCIPINQTVPFAVGIFFWKMRDWMERHIASWMSVVGALVFFLVAVLAVIFDSEYAIFYRQGLISLSFLFGLLLLRRYEVYIPSSLVWIGSRSYEIFILHFVLIWMIFR